MKKLPNIYKNNNIVINKNIICELKSINEKINDIKGDLKLSKKICTSIRTIDEEGTYNVIAITNNNIITQEGKIIKIKDVNDIKKIYNVKKK